MARREEKKSPLFFLLPFASLCDGLWGNDLTTESTGNKELLCERPFSSVSFVPSVVKFFHGSVTARTENREKIADCGVVI